MSSALDRLAKRGVSAPGERGMDIPLAKIRFDPLQPRKAYHHLDGRVAESDEAYITELAQTIEENGLIQPITVQEMGDDTYLVVVGECRTRAHLLLGKPTIRAVVRNDLTDPGRRLMYQLVENVTRQKLTDQELAESIQKLKSGADGMEPMQQTQIAKVLGKSEGWVSRFVKFGDEELQRLWVQTGIADSVEHVYRLSLLPSHMQVDIRRRVDLPETDREWLEKPLRREVVERFSKEAKIAKRAESGGAAAAGAGGGIPSEWFNQPAGAGVDNGWNAGPEGVEQKSDPVGAGGAADDVRKDQENQNFGLGSDSDFDDLDADGENDVPLLDVSEQGNALGAAVRDGYRSAAESSSSATPTPTPSSGDSSPAHVSDSDAYKLPDGARAAILGGAAAQEIPVNTSVLGGIDAPVNCRVSVGSVVALLENLQGNAEFGASLDSIRCDLNIPGALAQLIANELAGIIVDRKDVPALMQRELAKLGQVSA